MEIKYKYANCATSYSAFETTQNTSSFWDLQMLWAALQCTFLAFIIYCHALSHYLYLIDAGVVKHVKL